MLTLSRFNVRIVRTGDAYGLNDCLINDGAPLVEFYDNRHMHTPRGQFVSRYFVSTILERTHAGLMLDGGVPAWTVSADDMRLVDAYLRGFADAAVSPDDTRVVDAYLRGFGDAGVATV